MADAGPTLTLRVFLASPGDVAEERAFVRTYLESALPKSPLLNGKSVKFDVIAWDDPNAPAPMPAHLTPQEAVTKAKGRPADCDVVIVILASRLGTHLALDKYARPDGSAYRSGTEWEYEDAWNAGPRPEIRVYRRKDLLPIQPSDPARRAKLDQLDLVDSFFTRFINPDGSARGGYQPYSGLDDFETKLTFDLQSILAARIAPATAVGPASAPAPDAPTVSPPDRCFGRDADTAELVAALCAATTPTAVLVQGPGGIGKTTLTQDAANHPDVRARFGPRRWFVPLETATDRDTFDAALLAAIGLDPTAGFAAAPRRLTQAPTLLVLDNLETPWERAGPAIEARLGDLATIPGLALLASFRGQEAVVGVRWSLRRRVDPLPDGEARKLFRDIADTIPPDDPRLPDLLRALGGVPLAICLTARRAARHADLAGLWAEWQRLGSAVAAWHGAEPGRLTSVPHSIALSLQSSRVSPAGHRLFALLGQSPAGLAIEDRVALLDGDAFIAEEGLLAVGLAYLRDRRLDLLPPVRDHARRHCPPQLMDAAAWCRHFLVLTREQGGRIFRDAGGAEALDRLTPEVPNLDAALRSATKLSQREAAVCAAAGSYRLLSASGAGSIAALGALASDCYEAGDARGQAECKFYAGLVAFDRSDLTTALALYDEALTLYRQVVDLRGEANCIYRLGDMALRHTNHKAASPSFMEALQLYRREADTFGEANCVQRLGDIKWDRSEYPEARVKYDEALSLYRQAGDSLGEAVCFQRFGHIALECTDYCTAQYEFGRALQLYRFIGDARGEANCLLGFGDIALARSDHHTAALRYGEALPLFRQTGSVAGLGNYHLRRGRLERALDKFRDARLHYLEALTFFRQIQGALYIVRTLEELARVTTGVERSEYVAAVHAAWATMDLPKQVARVEREFG